jgi:hypothetical protein
MAAAARAAVEHHLGQRSSVTASASGSTRSTLPGQRLAGRERSTIAPADRRAVRRRCIWSKRTLIHRLPGSISSTTAWPATTVVPGSASRAVTRPSTGASSRRLARWAGAGTRNGRALRGDAGFEIDRVDLGQQVASGDAIAHVDRDARDSAGGRRPDAVAVSRLDRADAEASRGEHRLGDCRDGDRYRRQRSGAEGDVDEAGGE